MINFSSLGERISGMTGGGAGSRKPAGTRLSFRQLAAQAEKAPAGKSALSVHSDLDSSPADHKELYQEASDYLTEIMAEIRKGQPFSIDPAVEILEKIAAIQAPFDALFLKAIHSDDSHNFVVNHSVNLAIYSMKMAEGLNFSKTRQVEIGMLGLFHDIGMAIISDDIIYKKARLSESEFEQLKDRPKLGYDLLKQFEDDYPFLAEGTLQVYEKIDGSGYPKGLIGDEITEYAQIVGLVDVYEALIHTRPQRQRLPHFFAVKEIIRTGKGKFNRVYLKALLNTFSIFPQLSYVRLNSNAIGQVIKTYPDQPMRPKVRVIYDSQKQRILTERVINLPENPLLYITDSISEEELLAISESSELVSSTKQAAEVLTDKSNKGKKDGSVRRKGKGGRRRRWPFFRMGWVPLCIATVLFVAAAVLTHYNSMVMDSPSASAMVSPSSVYQHVDKDQKAFIPGGSTAPLSSPPESLLTKEDADPDVILPDGASGLRQTIEKAETQAAISSAIENPETTNLSSLAVSIGQAADLPTSEILRGPLPAGTTEWKATFPFSIKFPSHKNLISAEKAVSVLDAEGIPAHWVKVDLGNDGIWYRVFTGCFKDIAAARGFITERSLSGVLIKKTGYSNWVGSFPDEAIADEHIKTLRQKGFSAYRVEKDETIHVFVGAFYTPKGAADQHSALLACGIPNRIVQR